MSKNYWIVKQEPEAYSWDTFVKDGGTSWTGVRNFQARNNLRAMKKGDLVFFYHSVSDKQIVGLAKVGKEAYPDKTVKAMYWIQFEAYLPTNEYTYDYSKDEPVTFGGRPFWKNSNFGPTNNTPRAGGDGERTRQMLARAGYKLPAERMSVRLLHLVDESRRKELMIIYAEDLAPSGYSASQLLDGKEPGPEWKNIEHGLVERAKKRIKLSH